MELSQGNEREGNTSDRCNNADRIDCEHERIIRFRERTALNRGSTILNREGNVQCTQRVHVGIALSLAIERHLDLHIAGRIRIDRAQEEPLTRCTIDLFEAIRSIAANRVRTLDGSAIKDELIRVSAIRCTRSFL